MSFKLLEWKIEKQEIRMLKLFRGLKADENWMSAKTSWVRDVAGEVYKPS